MTNFEAFSFTDINGYAMTRKVNLTLRRSFFTNNGTRTSRKNYEDSLEALIEEQTRSANQIPRTCQAAYSERLDALVSEKVAITTL